MRRDITRPAVVGVVILAAGQGLRLGHGPKAVVPLAGRPMLAWALDAVFANSSVSDVVVVAPGDALSEIRSIADQYRAPVVEGGPTRQESAARGVAALPNGIRHVAVAEAARPLLPAGEIDRLMDRLLDTSSAVTGIIAGNKLFDTTHEISTDGSIVRTANREVLRGAQTPQLFCRACLQRAYRRVGPALGEFTDDAAVVLHDGGRVAVIDGDPNNIKITTERDLELAEMLIGARTGSALDMQGKVAIITGASSGVGAATARLLHDHGASVVLAARRGGRLKELVGELGESRAVSVECDIRSAEDARRLAHATVERFGQLDVLVANAGIGAYGSILSYSDDEVRSIVDTNLIGTIWCVRAAIPHMLDRGGDIVVVSSVAGLRGRANEAVYAATKHGLVGLAGALDRELRPKNIRVTTLCPGAVATEFAMGSGRTREMTALQTMLRADGVAEMIKMVLCQPRSMRTLLWSARSMSSEN